MISFPYHKAFPHDVPICLRDHYSISLWSPWGEAHQCQSIENAPVDRMDLNLMIMEKHHRLIVEMCRKPVVSMSIYHNSRGRCSSAFFVRFTAAGECDASVSCDSAVFNVFVARLHRFQRNENESFRLTNVNEIWLVQWELWKMLQPCNMFSWSLLCQQCSTCAP